MVVPYGPGVIPARESRFLPAVPTGFALGDREPLGLSLRRITLDEFDRAVTGLVDGPDIDAAVHAARKTMKRLRAVLRLVRGAIGDEAYRAENVVLRDAARSVAPMRDGWVMVKTVIDLRDRYSSHLKRKTFAELEERLTERHNHRRLQVLDDEEILPNLVHTLRSAQARFQAWPIETGTTVDGDRRPIRHTFDSLAPGLARTYRRGQRELEVAVATPTVENFHAWRKRVKYLRHQMEILEPLWPDVVGGYARSLERLGELAGEDHDLAVLMRLVGQTPWVCPNPVERSLLAALAQHRRFELQLASVTLGRRVYAEPPQRFVERLGLYWSVWDSPPPLGMTVEA